METNALTLLSLALVLGWVILLFKLRSLPYTFALMAMFGTVAHELLHCAVGFFLGARPLSISFFPVRSETGWTLGSVSFERLNVWNAAFISLAPLLLYPIAAVMFFQLMNLLESGRYLSWIFCGYMVASLIQSGTPSIVDLRVGFLSIVVYGSFGLITYMLLK